MYVYTQIHIKIRNHLHIPPTTLGINHASLWGVTPRHWAKKRTQVTKMDVAPAPRHTRSWDAGPDCVLSLKLPYVTEGSFAVHEAFSTSDND